MRRFINIIILFLCIASNVHGQTPEQIHIAFSGDHGMAISWATKSGNTKTSTVKYGLSPTSLGFIATGNEVTYYGDEYHHHVELQNLKPGSRYYYQCGDEASGFSTTRSFKSPIQGNDENFGENIVHKISVFGDWGYGKRAHALETRQALEKIKNNVDFIYHVGDLSYADDAFLHTPLKFEYENVYDGWMNWIENISDSKAYMVAPGNHESECHSPACMLSSSKRHALQNFSAYNKRWRMPSDKSGGVANMWYSFNYGLVHYITINTETDWASAPEEHHGDSGLLPAGGFAPSGEFLKWLENDLKKANASRHSHPWIIVGGHRPWYVDSNKIVNNLKATFEDLFLKYKVDIYFNGHKHHALRSWPIGRNGTVMQHNYINPQGIVHVTVGGAGCDEYKQPKNHTLPPFLASRIDYLSTGMLTVYNSTTLHFDLIRSSDMSIVDQFTLIKEN
jgi:acid phosphatase type 7